MWNRTLVARRRRRIVSAQLFVCAQKRLLCLCTASNESNLCLMRRDWLTGYTLLFSVHNRRLRGIKCVQTISRSIFIILSYATDEKMVRQRNEKYLGQHDEFCNRLQPSRCMWNNLIVIHVTPHHFKMVQFGGFVHDLYWARCGSELMIFLVKYFPQGL